MLHKVLPGVLQVGSGSGNAYVRLKNHCGHRQWKTCPAASSSAFSVCRRGEGFEQELDHRKGEYFGNKGSLYSRDGVLLVLNKVISEIFKLKNGEKNVREVLYPL